MLQVIMYSVYVFAHVCMYVSRLVYMYVFISIKQSHGHTVEYKEDQLAGSLAVASYIARYSLRVVDVNEDEVSGSRRIEEAVRSGKALSAHRRQPPSRPSTRHTGRTRAKGVACYFKQNKHVLFSLFRQTKQPTRNLNSPGKSQIEFGLCMTDQYHETPQSSLHIIIPMRNYRLFSFPTLPCVYIHVCVTVCMCRD